MIVTKSMPTVQVKPKTEFSINNKKVINKSSNNPFKVRANNGGGVYLDSDWSDSFNYVVTATLRTPTNVKVDENSFILIWDEVPNASKYEINLDGTVWESEYNSQSFMDIAAGVHTVAVRALGDSNIYMSSPWSEQLSFTKTKKLDQPGDLSVNNNTLSWTAVEDALQYELEINGDLKTLTENSFDMATLDPGEYSIRARALGDSHVYFSVDSEWISV
ncbi:MAG: hypothetical protein LBU60_02290 [Clostridiales bacterium]|jgi:hypothetical protein|nr:hypothetical protein [Clostridiales bacterium]